MTLAQPNAPEPNAPERDHVTSALLEKPGHRADIQGLRALAVVMVVLYHAGFGFHGGFVGVDAFFVLSGFVITRRLRWEVATTGRVNLKDFLRRRVVRILPAASITTVIAVLGAVLFAPMSGRSTAVNTAIAGALFNANNYLASTAGVSGGYFNQTTSLNPFMHMWSLSVEEQFYLVFPLVFLAAAVFANRRSMSADSTIIRVLCGLMVVSFVASLVAIRWNPSLAFYLAPFRAWEFLAGAAIVWIERIRWNRSSALLMSVIGGSLLLVAAWTFEEGEFFPGILALVPVVGTVLLIVAGSGSQSRVQDWLSHRIPGLIGRVSYAWYLWHWPLIVFAIASFGGTFVSLVAAVVASFVLAVGSTLYFEEPIRNRKWTGQDATRVALTCIGLSLIAALGALSFGRVVDQSETIGTLAQTFRQAGPAGETCLSVSNPADECTHRVDSPTGEVLLLGDSTAWQLFPGMIDAAEATDHNLTMASLRGCPTNGVEIRLFGFLRDEACPQFWDDALSDLEADSPDTVVVALATDWYINYESNEVIDPSGEFVSDPERRAELLRPALLETMSQLADRVDHLVFVGITPKFGDWQPTDCSFIAWHALDTCGLDRSWEEINAERAVARELEAEIVSETGAQFVNLDDFLCDDDGCATHRGDYWVFRDYGHISSDESERLGPTLAASIRNGG